MLSSSRAPQCRGLHGRPMAAQDPAVPVQARNSTALAAGGGVDMSAMVVRWPGWPLHEAGRQGSLLLWPARFQEGGRNALKPGGCRCGRAAGQSDRGKYDSGRQLDGDRFVRGDVASIIALNASSVLARASRPVRRPPNRLATAYASVRRASRDPANMHAGGSTDARRHIWQGVLTT